MKHWIFTFRVELPEGVVVSARNGASVFFAAYSPARGWEMVYPGGAEKIQAPQMIFVSSEFAGANPRLSPIVPVKTRKPVQMEMTL